MTGEDPATPAAKPDGHRGIRWWRWIGVFWLALGVAGVAVRQWYVVALAGLFLTGYLDQEVRAVQREEAPTAAPKAVLLSLLAAGLGAGSVYLMLRVLFKVTAPWWIAIMVFVALLVLYAAGPRLARRTRNRRVGRGPGFPDSWPP